MEAINEIFMYVILRAVLEGLIVFGVLVYLISWVVCCVMYRREGVN